MHFMILMIFIFIVVIPLVRILYREDAPSYEGSLAINRMYAEYEVEYNCNYRMVSSPIRLSEEDRQVAKESAALQPKKKRKQAKPKAWFVNVRPNSSIKEVQSVLKQLKNK